MTTPFAPYLLIPFDTVIYAAVREGHPDIVERLLAEDFKATESIPGWTEGNGWSLFIKRLFTEETLSG